MGRAGITNIGIAVAFAVTLAGCGSSGGGGTPAPPGSPSDPPSATTTITITSSGVSPRAITVAPGSRVTFVNNDNRPHEPASDPHPTHGSCPPIDQIGTIGAGQSRASGNMNTPGVCRFHDHLFDTNSNYNGTITVQ